MMQHVLTSLKVLTVSGVTCMGAVAPVSAATECGTATYYDHPGITANGEEYNPGGLTAAHPWLPLGSWVSVVDQDTGLSVDVRINDRGPWVGGHIIDLTPVAMNAIDPERTSDIRYVCLYQ